MATGMNTLPLRRKVGLTPERLRQTLERLGPTFIKIGQYLALRPDILDQAYCNELLKLVDRVPPDSLAVVQQVLLEELGGRLEDHFEWFATQPIAAGSLAQVYEARTLEGDHVAVKVQRAGAVERVDRDLHRMRSLLRFVRRSGLLPDVVAADLVEELRRWLHEELDFRRELSNLRRMHRLARDSDVLVVPKPWPSLSGPRVLTMDMVRGIPFSVLLREVREGETRVTRQTGFDNRLLGEGLIEAMLEQIFRFRLFQADSHPGNIIALPDNCVGFVDFGLVETLEPVLEASLFRYIRAIYRNDTDEMLRGLEVILVPGDWADTDGFRREFLEENRRWRRERGRENGGPTIGSYMMAVVRSARRHDFRLPAGILAIYRSLLTAEAVAVQLSGVDLGATGRAFFRRLEEDRILQLPSSEAVQADVLELVEIVREAPRKLDQLLSDLVANRFRLRVEEVTSLADRRLRDNQIRLVVAGLVFVGLAFLVGASRGVSFGGISLSAVLWGVLGVNVLWLALLWRRMM